PVDTGLLDVAGAVGLNINESFTRIVPSALTVGAIAASMWLLSVAARTTPIGTAYATWVGIGSFGAAVLGIVLFHEPFSAARGLFLALLVIAIIGLRATS